MVMRSGISPRAASSAKPCSTACAISEVVGGVSWQVSVPPYWQYTQSSEHCFCCVGMGLTPRLLPKRRERTGP